MSTCVDYKNFKLSKLFTKEYRHLLLLLYVPLHILLFIIVEGIYDPERAHVMYSPLDDIIPFVEAFIIPYILWYAYLVGVGIYLMFCDVACFKRMMYFIILTFFTSVLIYIFLPTIQPLRPDVFPRDNVFTRMIGLIYSIDPPNNVCPSLHVVGSFAAFFGVLDSKRFSKPYKILGAVLCLSIVASTVFIKQHSVLDILGGLIMTGVGVLAVYVLPKLIKRKKGSD